MTTCIGIVFAVPMFILCGFEFALYSRLNRAEPNELASTATIIGIFEILVGIFNIVSLFCGIFVLFNAAKLRAQANS